jgi:hypothetical protein
MENNTDNILAAMCANATHSGQKSKTMQIKTITRSLGSPLLSSVAQQKIGVPHKQTRERRTGRSQAAARDKGGIPRPSALLDARRHCDIPSGCCTGWQLPGSCKACRHCLGALQRAAPAHGHNSPVILSTRQGCSSPPLLITCISCTGATQASPNVLQQELNNQVLSSLENAQACLVVPSSSLSPGYALSRRSSEEIP